MKYPNNNGGYKWEKFKSPLKMMDKSTMQYWMARIFLKVTNVRVERLQDMSHENLLAEGFDFKYFDTKKKDKGFFSWWINLWNSTSKDGYKWEDNPFVFVYEFERIEK